MALSWWRMVEGKIYTYVLRCEELYPGIFTCTNEEFESTLNTYGQCGKYEIDRENQRIRLTKLDGFIEGTSDIQQLSTLKLAGLSNIKGKFVVDDDIRSTATGAFYNGASFNYDASSSTSNGGYIEFDASRSNPIYGGSAKVQPQAIIVLTYIKIQ